MQHEGGFPHRLRERLTPQPPNRRISQRLPLRARLAACLFLQLPDRRLPFWTKVPASDTAGVEKNGTVQ